MPIAQGGIVMRTTMIFVATILALAGGANAATFGGQAKTIPADFTQRLTTVCQSSTLVLTTAARSACTSGAFPRVTAASSAFVNSGTGAELNTLMRQLPPTAAK
jgi:hypothetical protein